MVRLSTLATSTLTSALKVLSTVLPDSMFFSFVPQSAPPLPGLWCWNQMKDHSCPSRFRNVPFFRSWVVARLGRSPVSGRSSAPVNLRCRALAGAAAGKSNDDPPGARNRAPGGTVGGGSYGSPHEHRRDGTPAAGGARRRAVP